MYNPQPQPLQQNKVAEKQKTNQGKQRLLPSSGVPACVDGSALHTGPRKGGFHLNRVSQAWAAKMLTIRAFLQLTEEQCLPKS